jgi:hypothetical protein
MLNSWSWLRGIDGELRNRDFENHGSEEDVLEEMTKEINSGIQSCIDNHSLMSSVASRYFSVKISEILPDVVSSAKDILALLFC